MEFKGTKGDWHVVEYAGYFNLQSGKYYGDENILDSESVGSDKAEANAKLARSAPDLLKALQHMCNYVRRENLFKGMLLDVSERAIKKAIG